MASRHFIIAGAGLMGSLAGWQLARAGHRVTLLERSQPGQPESAAYTAAAMVAPFSERAVSDPVVFEHGKRSLTLWPELLRQLSDDSGEVHRFQQQGSLLVAHPSDRAEMHDFQHHLTHCGLANDAAVECVDRHRIAELEPELAGRFEQGVFMPTEGHLANRPMLSSLHRTIQRLGGDVRYGVSVDIDGEDWRCEGEVLVADGYLDTRGVGAQPNMPGLRGVRGEVVWVQSDEVRIQRPVRLLHPRYRLYLVPKGNGRYILGATELESDDRSPMTVRSSLELLSALYTISPRLGEASILEMNTNLRPALPNHCPDIQVEGCVARVNGLFRHGYLLAPALLELLAAQLDWFEGEAVCQNAM